MKQKRKRIGSMVLAICMLLTMMPGVAFSEVNNYAASLGEIGTTATDNLALPVEEDVLEIEEGTVEDGVRVIDLGSYDDLSSGKRKTITINRPKGSVAEYSVSAVFEINSGSNDKGWIKIFDSETGGEEITDLIEFAPNETSKTLYIGEEHDSGQETRSSGTFSSYIYFNAFDRTTIDTPMIRLTTTTSTSISASTLPTVVSASVNSILYAECGESKVLEVNFLGENPPEGTQNRGFCEVTDGLTLKLTRGTTESESESLELKPTETVGSILKTVTFIIPPHKTYGEEWELDSITGIKNAADGAIINLGKDQVKLYYGNELKYDNVPVFGPVTITPDKSVYKALEEITVSVPVQNYDILKADEYFEEHWKYEFYISYDGVMDDDIPFIWNDVTKCIEATFTLPDNPTGSAMDRAVEVGRRFGELGRYWGVYGAYKIITISDETQGFNPIKSITVTGIPTSNIIIGKEYPLSVNISPTDATYKGYSWTVDSENAEIKGNNLIFNDYGKATITLNFDEETYRKENNLPESPAGLVKSYSFNIVDPSLPNINLTLKDGYRGEELLSQQGDGDGEFYGISLSEIAKLSDSRAIGEYLRKMMFPKILVISAPNQWGKIKVDGNDIDNAIVNVGEHTLSWENVSTTKKFSFTEDAISGRVYAFKLEKGLNYAPVNVKYTNGKDASVEKEVGLPYDLLGGLYVLIYEPEGIKGNVRMYQKDETHGKYISATAAPTTIGKNPKYVNKLSVTVVRPDDGRTLVYYWDVPFTYSTATMSDYNATVEFFNAGSTVPSTVRYCLIDEAGSIVTGTNGKAFPTIDSGSFGISLNKLYENLYMYKDLKLLVEYEYSFRGENLTQLEYYSLDTLSQNLKNGSKIGYFISLSSNLQRVIVPNSDGSMQEFKAPSSKIISINPGDTIDVLLETGNRRVGFAILRITYMKRVEGTAGNPGYWEPIGTTPSEMVSLDEKNWQEFTPNRYTTVRFKPTDVQLPPRTVAKIDIQTILNDGYNDVKDLCWVKMESMDNIQQIKKIEDILNAQKFFHQAQMSLNVGDAKIEKNTAAANSEKGISMFDPNVARAFDKIITPLAIPSQNPFTFEVRKSGDEYVVRGYANADIMNNAGWVPLKDRWEDASFNDVFTQTKRDVRNLQSTSNWPGIRGYIEGKATVSSSGDIYFTFHEGSIKVQTYFKYFPKELFDLDYYCKWGIAFDGMAQSKFEIGAPEGGGDPTHPLNFNLRENTFAEIKVITGYNGLNVDIGVYAVKAGLHGGIEADFVENATYRPYADVDKQIERNVTFWTSGDLYKDSSSRFIDTDGLIDTEESAMRLWYTKYRSGGESYNRTYSFIESYSGASRTGSYVLAIPKAAYDNDVLLVSSANVVGGNVSDAPRKVATNKTDRVEVWMTYENNSPTVDFSNNSLMFKLNEATEAMLYAPPTGDRIDDYIVEMDGDGNSIVAVILKSGKIEIVRISNGGDVTIIQNNLPTANNVSLIYNGSAYMLACLGKEDGNGDEAGQIKLSLYEINTEGFVTGTVFSGVPENVSGEFRLFNDKSNSGVFALVWLGNRKIDDERSETVLYASRISAVTNNTAFVSAPIEVVAELPEASENDVYVHSYEADMNGNILNIDVLFREFEFGTSNTEVNRKEYQYLTSAVFSNEIETTPGANDITIFTPDVKITVDIKVKNKGFEPIKSITVDIDGESTTIEGDATNQWSILPNFEAVISAAFTPKRNLQEKIYYTVTATFEDNSEANSTDIIYLSQTDIAAEILSSMKEKDVLIINTMISNNTPFSLSGRKISVGIYEDSFGNTSVAQNVFDGAALEDGDFSKSVLVEFELANTKSLPQNLYLVAKAYDSSDEEIPDYDNTNNILTVNNIVIENEGGSSGGGDKPSDGGNSKPKPEIKPEDNTENKFILPPTIPAVNFSDVAQSAWYAGAVEYVQTRGLMKGTGDDKFSPDATATRAMLWTVLYRLASSPAQNITSTNWYTAAQEWAKSNDISDGLNPDDSITREQLVTLLYRFAQKKGLDVSKSGDLSIFVDADDVSLWATKAMEWAVGNGIISGKGNGVLDSKNTATRAEIATILMRFIEQN